MTASLEKPEARPVPEGHVRLTIDGEEVDAPTGELLIRTCERLGITWLEREQAVFGAVRFLGTTLWADFDALVLQPGAPEPTPQEPPPPEPRPRVALPPPVSLIPCWLLVELRRLDWGEVNPPVSSPEVMF